MKTPEDLKILLAEDNKINQRIASMTFIQMGLHIDIASNGKIAFEMFQNKSYDLILMDVQMPVMDGLDSTSLIRKFEKDSNRNTKAFIVALTASEISDKREKCFGVGMDDFLEKPVRPESLRKIFSQAFNL